MGETRYSEFISCGHCTNYSKMEIIGSVADTVKDFEDGFGYSEYGKIYEILKCAACDKRNILSYDWHDAMEPEDEMFLEILFPVNQNTPLGLPKDIQQAFEAAEKVKNIDVNAYAILMRRLLEMICLDRQAKNDTLFKMLYELASKGEIPDPAYNNANPIII